MLHKSKIITLLSLLFIGFLGYVIRNPLFFGICFETYAFGSVVGCSDDSIQLIGEPILIFFFATLPSVLLLMFVNETVTKTWWKFAKWWLGLSVVFLLIAPAQGNGIPPDLVLTKERVAWLMGSLFGIISLVLIAVTVFRKKSSDK